MDTVPIKFVDSVVELFDGEKTLNPLAEEVAHPLWKAAVDVHHRNRVYYKICIREIAGDIKIVSEQQGTEIYEDLGSIRKNRRFARIVCIEDQTECYDDPLWDVSAAFTEVDAAKQLESVAPQLEQSSRVFVIDLRCQDIFLNSLYSRFFGGISLVYDGQTSLTFLEKQIAHSPFLDTIDLHEGEYRWPQSVLPLIEQFCLRGRPGRRVYLEIHDTMEAMIDINFVEKFFEHWKEKGTLNFTLVCDAEAVDLEDWQTLFKKGQVTELERGNFRSVIKHETAKSIAVCCTGAYRDFSLVFHTCTCDLSEKCFLKERYPEYHDF
uniref:FBA_2 domain-containing protein n=1 Tax=Steinernema glaseri TaxID=37863 RepID=A0A1I7ZE22_9BILA